jgi:hypothetical protein
VPRSLASLFCPRSYRKGAESGMFFCSPQVTLASNAMSGSQ